MSPSLTNKFTIIILAFVCIRIALTLRYVGFRFDVALFDFASFRAGVHLTSSSKLYQSVNPNLYKHADQVASKNYHSSMSTALRISDNVPQFNVLEVPQK